MLYIHYLKHSRDTSTVKSKTSIQSYAVHPLLKTFKRHFHCQVKNKHPILCCISIRKNVQKILCVINNFILRRSAIPITVRSVFIDKELHTIKACHLDRNKLAFSINLKTKYDSLLQYGYWHWEKKLPILPANSKLSPFLKEVFSRMWHIFKWTIVSKIEFDILFLTPDFTQAEVLNIL